MSTKEVLTKSKLHTLLRRNSSSSISSSSSKEKYYDNFLLTLKKEGKSPSKLQHQKKIHRSKNQDSDKLSKLKPKSNHKGPGGESNIKANPNDEMLILNQNKSNNLVLKKRNSFSHNNNIDMEQKKNNKLSKKYEKVVEWFIKKANKNSNNIPSINESVKNIIIPTQIKCTTEIHNINKKKKTILCCIPLN